MTFFRTQSDMFEHAEQNQDQVLCAVELNGRGYKYTSFATQEAYADFILSGNDGDFCNEMLRDATSSYFDIDSPSSLQSLGFTGQKQFLDKYTKAIQSAFKRYFNVKVKKKEFFWSESCRPGKTSFHCKVDHGDYYWHKDDRKELKQFVLHMSKELLYEPGFYYFEQSEDGSYTQKSTFDSLVYSKNRLFRSVSCRKRAYAKKLTPCKGKITQKSICDHLISVCPDERQRLRFKSTLKPCDTPVLEKSLLERLASEQDSRVHEIKGSLVCCRNRGKKRLCGLTNELHESQNCYFVSKKDAIYLYCHGCPGRSKKVYEHKSSQTFGDYETYKQLLKTHEKNPTEVGIPEVHQYLSSAVKFIDDPNGCYYVIRTTCDVEGFHGRLRNYSYLKCQNLFHRNSDVVLRRQGETISFSHELAELCKLRKLPSYNKTVWLPYSSRSKYKPSLDPNIFNRFAGYALENAKCDWEQIDIEQTATWTLLYRNLCNESRESFGYLISFLAHRVQKSWIKLPICHIWCGAAQGVGKSSLLVLLSRIFATNARDNIVVSHNSLQKMESKFNNELSTNLFIGLEEMRDRKTSRQFDSYLKDFVSNSHVMVERKGFDRTYERSFSTCILLSNSYNVTKVEKTDRRQVFYECSNVGINDGVFFGRLYEEFDNIAIMKAWFEFLLNKVDITGWDYRKFPVCETRLRMQEISKDVNDRFCEWLLSTDLRDKPEVEMCKTELFLCWSEFIDSENLRHFQKRDKNFVCSSFEMTIGVTCKNGRYVITRDCLNSYLKKTVVSKIDA